MGMTGVREDTKLRRAALAFDFSEIPDGAVVTGVSLQMKINKAPPGAALGTARLHRFKSDWGEGASLAQGLGGAGGEAATGDVTWIHQFYDTDNWTLPGGDFMSVPSSEAPYGGSSFEDLVFPSSVQLIADVQAWLADPSVNYGWIIVGDEATEQNARRLASREETDGTAPALTVDYFIPSVVDNLQLTPLTEDLDDPISMAHAGDGSKRVFIVEQRGVIRIFDLETQSLLPTPFLDISSTVYSVGNEQGLLGLAFHPNYPVNGLFYVNYTSSPSGGVWHTVVEEFQVSGDPDIADTSGRMIMRFEQDDTNHNAGDLHFGPDGYLYIASGDGGGREDEYDNGQNIDTLLGALLRIDVDGTPEEGAETCGIISDYGIPPGNAFPANNDGCDEILHFGLRNPWRFSFDAKNSDLWIADVGQYVWEEANQLGFEESGVNLGWSCREGANDFDGTPCISPYRDPVIEYRHELGNCAITGGYVYRGTTLPLEGRYLYGDFCTARVWVATFDGDNWISEEWEETSQTLQSLASFGQDEACNLYLIDRDAATGLESPHGALYRIDDSERVFGAGFEFRNCR